MSRVQLTFHGGVDGNATGTQYLLELAKARFFFDAGLYTGAPAESEERNRQVPFDPRTLNAILLTHAHLGHCGRIPYLVRRGFRGPIWLTPATRDLCAVTLPDAADILQKDAEERRARGWRDAEPLFERHDAREAQALMVGLPYRRPTYLRKNLFFEFTDAGHVPGSASIALRFDEGKGHRLVYSGDVGRRGALIVRDPDPPAGPIDTLIMGCGVTSAPLPSPAQLHARLAELVNTVHARGGSILVPALPAGRSQEFLAALHILWRDGKIPRIPVLVDSRRAVGASELLNLHPEIFWRAGRSEEQQAKLFEFPLLQRRSLDAGHDGSPAIIIAGAGSCAFGPVVSHLQRLAPDPRHLILFLRLQPNHTLGRRIQEGLDELELPSGPIRRQAEVETLDGFGGHGDLEDMRHWVRGLGGPVIRAFVVHGDDASRQAMAVMLKAEGVQTVEVPRTGDTFRLQ